LIKSLHLSTSDFNGGAARAAYRIHLALVASGSANRMQVLHRGNDDDSVSTNTSRPFTARLAQKIHRRWVKHGSRDWKTDNPVLHTFGQIGTGLVPALTASDADLLNLHWISNMLSVADIGKLKKPIIWTLHDMWAFCGGEHYVPDDKSARFREGYRTDNRPPGESGPDLNRLTWEAKRRSWARQHFTIVCPSNWLARCAHESVLFAESHVHVIPNCLDTRHTWQPIPRTKARKLLGLPLDKKLILFGADGGVSDPRKGGDLLHEGLARVISTKPHLYELLIFGQSKSTEDNSWPCHVHWLGAVDDDHQLVLAYSAADLMVVPSRQDNLPNTAIEAQACGIPVAAFTIGGLPDIVTHQATGWLARTFDATDLAEGIIWLLEDEARYAALAAAARKQAVERFSEAVIADKYTKLYHQVLARFSSQI